jgi:hypothetical protein
MVPNIHKLVAAGVLSPHLDGRCPKVKQFTNLEREGGGGIRRFLQDGILLAYPHFPPRYSIINWSFTT